MRLLAIIFAADCCWNIISLVNCFESKPLYIRISDTAVFTCPRYAGLVNKKYLELDKDSIRVFDVDRPSENVQVIKLPGRYRLEFRNLRVTGKDLELLVGDINSKIRVKLFGSFSETEIRVVPNDAAATSQSSSFNQFGFGPSQQQQQGACPKGGKLVEVESQKFSCRHCDLCDQSRDFERDLDQHKIISAGGGDDVRFSSQCSQFKSGKTYNIARTIDLPDPNKAKEIIDSSVNLLASVQDAFATGKGRMIVELRLLTKPRSLSKEQYCQDKCGDKSNYVCWHWFCGNEYDRQVQSGKITSLSSSESCVKQGDGTELAACYDIEFSYDASADKPPEVQDALGNSNAIRDFPANNNNVFNTWSSANAEGPTKSPLSPNSGQRSLDPCGGQPSWCRGCWWCGQEWCTSACKSSRRRRR